jgi:PAS domain S-box-containing protein
MPSARLPLGLALPRATLRSYLVAVILLATVPMAVLMAAQLFSEIRAQEARTAQEISRSADALAQAVERELASTVDALTILAHTDSLERGDVEGFRRLLRERPWLRASWSSLTIAPADASQRFDRSIDGRDAALSSLTKDPAGKPATSVLVPVTPANIPPQVLSAWIDAAHWRELLDKAAMPMQGSASLFDATHHVIAGNSDAPPQLHLGQTLPPTMVEVMAARPAGADVLMRSTGGDTTYSAWRRLPGGWGVVVGVASAPLELAHRKAIARALGTTAACLLLGVSFALLAARGVTRPLHTLANGGPAQTGDAIAVHEIALLHDALMAAEAQDAVARARLQNKADEFEALFNSSPIGLAFAQDPQCRVVLHNAAMNELMGPPEDEARVGGVRLLHRGARLERADHPLQRAAQHGEAVHAMELEVLSEERAPRFVIAHAVPLLDAQGRPRGALGAVVDITARKLAEAHLISTDRRLRESQHLVDLAQEAGHVGFFRYLFDADSVSWSAGQAKLFGIEHGPFEGTLKDWAQRIHPEDRERVEQGLRHMVSDTQPRQMLDFRVATPDGSLRWLSTRLVLSFGDDGRPLQMIGVTVDMTDQKKAERERAALVEREQAARREAEAASRAKDEFLAMLGHELRNPLGAISSAVEVLNRVGAGEPSAISARTIIARQTRHLSHLMDDLLDVARVISGKVVLTPQTADLAALVQRLVGTLELTGATHQHTMHSDLKTTPIHADLTRIEQVVNNLLTNALKYTPAGGRIDVRVCPSEGRALLEVRDTGQGIAPELLPRIFDLFVQGERPLDRRGGGLGIGLTLVNRLVGLHGGTVSVDSSREGTVFQVFLPLAEEAPSILPGEPRLPSGRHRRVLIIEDNQDAVDALSAMLRLDGHTVWTAMDGIGGLDALLTLRPEVAVIDIGLPGLNGFEVAQRSRAAGYPGRLVALSGYGQGHDVRRALQAGFDAHLVKPVDSERLRELLVAESIDPVELRPADANSAR